MMQRLERSRNKPQSSKKRKLAIRALIDDTKKRFGKKLSWNEAREIYWREVEDAEVWVNDTYAVYVHPDKASNSTHLSIKRHDRETIHDWRDLQEIKNQLIGPDCEAVELYPAEDRRVDLANQYHLWCSNDPTFRFPLGFKGRAVDETGQRANQLGAKQRPMKEEGSS